MPLLYKLLPLLPGHADARVGRTPMVRLQSIPRDEVSPDVEIWCKLEWFNPAVRSRTVRRFQWF